MKFVRMFQPEFVPLVLSGRKRQTIRPTPKRMPAPGDRISLRVWMDRPYRSKQVVLWEATIIGVDPIQLGRWGATVNGRFLEPWDLDELALADGFDGWIGLRDWFSKIHGLPFSGILIRWGEDCESAR